MVALCDICGKPIHPERLELLPATKRCVDCAREKGSDVVVHRSMEQYFDMDAYRELLDSISD